MLDVTVFCLAPSNIVKCKFWSNLGIKLCCCYIHLFTTYVLQNFQCETCEFVYESVYKIHKSYIKRIAKDN